MSGVSKVYSQTNHFRHGFLSSCCVVEFFCLVPLAVSVYLYVCVCASAHTLSLSFTCCLSASSYFSDREICLFISYIKLHTNIHSFSLSHLHTYTRCVCVCARFKIQIIWSECVLPVINSRGYHSNVCLFVFVLFCFAFLFFFYILFSPPLYFMGSAFFSPLLLLLSILRLF